MNELTEGLLTLIDAVGPLAWLVVVGSFIVMIIFLLVFVWFARKIFNEFNKPFFRDEYEEENRALKQKIKQLKNKRG